VVHADAVRNKSVRGATVYTLSETGSDAEADELAHNENKSDLIAGVDLAEESDEIAGILIDLAQREAKNHASFFARSIVKELKQTTRFTGKPLRSAGFRVLRAPDVPSILLELGYLSHDADEDQLKSVAWRSKIAARLAHAVDVYFRTNVASGP
jgi:N-acetylmuramoyl-L-alanine amidase